MREYIVKISDEYIERLKSKGLSDKYELIRCKDCKYWGEDGYRDGCKYATIIMTENDFCSMAERKEE